VATTAVFAEILIAGLEAAAWLALLVAGIVGTDWIDTERLHGWEALTTAVVLAAAYVLGILVDRFADSFHRWLAKAWPGRAVDKPASIPRMRLTMLQVGGDLARFFEYQRSRQRIARATAVNCALAVPVAAWYVAPRSGVGPALGAAAALLLATLVSEAANRRIEFAYVTRLGDAYRIVRDLPEEADRAAAVPYRRREDGEIEFLLVTTTGARRRWTFPKGRRDPEDETLADTALREAREEAGVAGKLDGRRLGEYRFPRRSGEPHVVAAFLLEVDEERPERWRKGKDAKRERAWCSRDDALGRIGDDDPEYRAELERVLGAASEALGSRSV
jgi:8-oxo-dGTP pyrophosphatase MutT (NUDIX family)